MRLLLLDEVFEADQDRHGDVLRWHITKLTDDILVQLLHDLDLELFPSHHQVSQCVEALYSEIVASDDCELRQNGENDVAQFEMVIDEKLRVLHERLNVLANCVSVLRARKRLHKDRLGLRRLHHFDLVSINV